MVDRALTAWGVKAPAGLKERVGLQGNLHTKLFIPPDVAVLQPPPRAGAKYAQSALLPAVDAAGGGAGGGGKGTQEG